MKWHYQARYKRTELGYVLDIVETYHIDGETPSTTVNSQYPIVESDDPIAENVDFEYALESAKKELIEQLQMMIDDVRKYDVIIDND